MTYQINYAYASHIGNVRTNNEDNLWCCGETLPVCNRGTGRVCTGRVSRKALPALAVFDGMGGESCGEVASGLAAQEFGRYYEMHRKELKRTPEQFLRDICRSMNREVCRYGEENRIGSMGTTAAMLVFGREKVYAGNLGDSRVYCSKDGMLRQISTDHVAGRSMFGKAPLTQYLGIMEESMALDPSGKELSCDPGSRYLICSDGMTDMLSDGEIADVLAREIPVEQTVELLLERTLKKGGRDNVTIVLCEVEKEADNPFSMWIKRFIAGKSEGDV